MNTFSLRQNQNISLLNEIELLKEKIIYLENKLEQNRSNKIYRSITISIKGQKTIVPFNNIIMIKADSNYSTIYSVDNRSVLTSKTLKYWQDIINHSQFIRVHKSYLINSTKIKIQVGNYIELEGGLIVKLSRRNIKALK